MSIRLIPILGQRIEALRLEMGLSHTALAKRAGVGLSTVKRACRGEFGEIENIERLFTALGYSKMIDDALVAILPDAQKSPYKTLAPKRKRVSKSHVTHALSVWPEDEDVNKDE